MGLILDTRCYITINTTEYNENSTAMVQSCNGLRNCSNLGWDIDEQYPCIQTQTQKHIGELEIGDMIMSKDYQGAYLMRVG